MTRYKRDWWYVAVCCGCRRVTLWTGAQINAGKRFCSLECQQ